MPDDVDAAVDPVQPSHLRWPSTAELRVYPSVGQLPRRHYAVLPGRQLRQRLDAQPSVLCRPQGYKGTRVA